MKKIWTLLVAAITVLAVLTSGCGSSDMGEVMRALCDMDQPFYLRPDHGRRIWDEAWSIREVTDADGTQRVEHRPDGWNGVKPGGGLRPGAL
mgnify:CR=1 FL=1